MKYVENRKWKVVLIVFMKQLLHGPVVPQMKFWQTRLCADTRQLFADVCYFRCCLCTCICPTVRQTWTSTGFSINLSVDVFFSNIWTKCGCFYLITWNVSWEYGLKLNLLLHPSAIPMWLLTTDEATADILGIFLSYILLKAQWWRTGRLLKY